MKHEPGTPAASLLDAALLLGPLAYLALDCTYAARGWWDAPTGALHVVVAAVYGLTALRLATMVRGRLQAVLLVVLVLGVVGNAGVGQDALSVGLGGPDLFQEDGPANVFKTMGFFFPLTFLLAAAGLRGRVPGWTAALLALGAVLFPVAHVANVSWLAIVDGVLLVVALGSVHAVRDQVDDAQASSSSDTSSSTRRRISSRMGRTASMP
jgi:hypothetical protein